MQSIAENNPAPLLGIDTGSPKYKTNALATEPNSRLTDAVVRDAKWGPKGFKQTFVNTKN